MSVLPSLDQLKSRARQMRRDDPGLTHSAALERIAHDTGYRDWNALSAAIRRIPQTRSDLPPVGSAVTGRYLGHAFRGTLIGAQQLGGGAKYRVDIRFDAPLNVSAFDSMEILRRQIHAVIDRHGVSAAHRSDGVPHLELAV